MLGNEVAVEEVGKVGANVIGTAALWAVPWVVGAALELGEELGLGGGCLGEVVVVVDGLEGLVLSIGAGAFGQVAAPALLGLVVLLLPATTETLTDG